MPGRIEFRFNNSHTRNKQVSGKTFRILLMGNYSGINNHTVNKQPSPLVSRRIHPVDVDNFNELMSEILPHLILQVGTQIGPHIGLEFRDLDDFHPDSLYCRLSLFKALRDLRNNLLNEKTYLETAAILGGETNALSADLNAHTEDAIETDDTMFERLLGKKSVQLGNQETPSHTNTGIEQFIQAIVAHHIIPSADPMQQTYLDAVDDSISTEMRQLLHNPDFQALESLWRSLYQMVTGLETGEELQLYMLDVRKEELLADFFETEYHPEKSAIYQLLVEQSVNTPGGEPWSAIVGSFNFGVSEEDTRALESLGAIAANAGGPFLASASIEILGCTALSDYSSPDDWKPLDKQADARWQALRKSPSAPWIGLVLPRILLRLPYGSNTDEIDDFTFEEIPNVAGNHEHLLWGNAAYICAMLLGLAFQKNGASMQPGDVLDLGGLPAYVFDTGEEKQLIPCAETFISERVGERILELGLMPLLSYRHRNQVRLMRFQSITEPLQSLRGPWN